MTPRVKVAIVVAAVLALGGGGKVQSTECPLPVECGAYCSNFRCSTGAPPTAWCYTFETGTGCAGGGYCDVCDLDRPGGSREPDRF